MAERMHKPEDCWKRIGVQGDRSCPELEQVIHCRNCPVYSEAALNLLDRPLPPDYLREWTEHFAKAVTEAKQSQLIEAKQSHSTKSLMIFRVGREWLALPPVLFLEVLEMRPIHSLPHRRNRVVLGLVNVRGSLLICVSLAALLGLEVSQEERRAGRSRLMVISHGEDRFAFPADEVHGTHPYDPCSLEEIPATVGKATPVYTQHILPWQGKSVACLDAELLLGAFNRSLS